MKKVVLIMMFCCLRLAAYAGGFGPVSIGTNESGIIMYDQHSTLEIPLLYKKLQDHVKIIPTPSIMIEYGLCYDCPGMHMEIMCAKDVAAFAIKITYTGDAKGAWLSDNFLLTHADFDDKDKEVVFTYIKNLYASLGG